MTAPEFVCARNDDPGDGLRRLVCFAFGHDWREWPSFRTCIYCLRSESRISYGEPL